MTQEAKHKLEKARCTIYLMYIKGSISMFERNELLDIYDED